MQHVAIDLGSRESQICARDKDGVIVDEARLSTSALPSWLGKQPHSCVVMEACSEAFAVADAASEAGHEVRVVPGTLVRALGVGARGIKRDVRDARALSEASCRMSVPSVHITSPAARRLKTLCGMRNALVRSRTLLINTVRGWMRTNLVRPRSGVSETLPQRVRDACETVPGFVQRQLLTIEMLTDQIKDADKEMATIAAQSKVCVRLTSIPGVGVATAVLFEATVDDVTRFSSAHSLTSYLGLTPGERSSGDKKRTTGITKAGPPQMRWLLVQCAWSFLRLRPNDPAAQWATKIMERRGRMIGIIALARKLAGIMFALWRKETNYCPVQRPRRALVFDSGAAVLAAARHR